jgi:hypothetical protein
MLTSSILPRDLAHPRGIPLLRLPNIHVRPLSASTKEPGQSALRHRLVKLRKGRNEPASTHTRIHADDLVPSLLEHGDPIGDDLVDRGVLNRVLEDHVWRGGLGGHLCETGWGEVSWKAGKGREEDKRG